MPNIVDLRKKNKGSDKIVIASAADARQPSLRGAPASLADPSAIASGQAPQSHRLRLLRSFHSLAMTGKWYIPAGILVALIVLILSFTLFKKDTQTTSAAWFSDEWHYRATFDVFNASTTQDLIDFQVEMPTSTLALRTAWTNGKLRNDFKDLRFTDSAGNLLDYWFPDATSTMMSVYLKMPTMPKNATSTVMMYYGNPSAPDKRDGNKVFPDFFDDFSDGTYAAGPKLWTVDSGTFAVAGSDKYLSITADGAIRAPSAKAYGTWEFNWYKGGNDNNLRVRPIWNSASSHYSFNAYTNEAIYFFRWDGGETDLFITAASYIANNTWYRTKITRTTAGVFTVYIKGGAFGNTNWTEVVESSGSNPTAADNTFTTSSFLAFAGVSGDRVDNLLWRKFATTDPRIVATAGTSEETGTAPVGYWNFDEGYGTTANDSSSSNNDGTLTNMSTTGTSTAWTTGKMGKALQFDGVNDYVSLPGATASAIGNVMTIEAWVNPSSLSNRPTIFSTRRNNAAGSFQLEMGTGNGGTNRVSVTSPNVWNLESNNNKVSVGQWYHVVYTKSGTAAGNQKLYINGILQSLTTDNIQTFANNTDVKLIGGGTSLSGSNPNHFFKGLIDELKIYNYALSAAQIKTEYNRGTSAKLSISPSSEQDIYQGLIGYWKMDESTTVWDGTGDRVNDYSGLGNHGTASGNAHATTTAKYGNAGEFDGTDDYVTVPSGATLAGKTQATISVWVYADDFGVTGCTYCENTSTIGYTRLGLYVNTSGKIFFVYRDSSQDPAGTASSLTGDTTLSAATWYYITAVYDADTDKQIIYLNGKEEKKATASVAGFGTSATAAIRIGDLSGSSEWDGYLDDVKVYSLARTPDQIMQDYLQGPGPIASYNFEEKSGTTVNDISGRGNNGTITAGASKGFVKGKIGRAYDFDGSATFISADSNPITGTSPFTISAWLNIETSSTYGLAVYMGNAVSSQSAWIGYGATAQVGTSNSIGGGFYGRNYGSGTAANTGWHYVTLTFSGGSNGTALLYVDGIQKVNDTYTPNLASTSIMMGKANSGTAYWYNGLVDEAKIYNYALTPWQISQEYNGGKPIAHWGLDEGRGTSAYNTYATSTNALAGTLTNMSTTGTSTAWITGKFGKALLFDGINDTVTINDNTGTGLDITSAGSLSAWVKPTSVSGNKYIIDKAENTAYALLLSGDDVKGYFGNSSCSGGMAKANEWSYVSVAWDGAYIRCYLNGTQVAQTAYSTALTPQNTSLYIGSDGGAASYFSGLIDEVKIYNYALSPVQIKKDYNDGAAVVLGTSDGGQNVGQGLVGYWKMDEATTTWDGTGDRVNDYSGNGNNGTASGNAHATTTATYGNAAEFDGTGDYVEISDNSTLDITGELTLSAWVKIRSTDTSNYGGVAKYANVAPYSAQRAYGFWFNANATTVNTTVSDDGTFSSGHYTSLSSNTSIGLNTWAYVTITYKPAAFLRVYINGQLDNETKTGVMSSIFNSSAPLWIGTSYSNTDANMTMNGLIDDVKVYSLARTPDQIMQDYLQGPGPIASYNFEEKSGTTVNDISGNGYNGTITAGASKGFIKGKIGRAYDFDGANTKIDTGSDWLGAVGYRTQNITVSAWIYLNGFGEGGGGRILDNGKFQFYVNSTNNKLSFSSNASTVANSANSALTTSSWYYVTLTRNSAGTANLYVNGVLSGTASQSSGTPVAGTTNAIIGNDNGQTATFNGKIDDLKVYNYVLTPWQISQEYNGGGPMGYWKMDEGENKTIYDWSGKGNNGALSLSGSPATSTAWAAESACKKGRCLDFDGSNDKVTTTDSPFDFTGNFSLSAWIYPEAVDGNYHEILAKAEGGGYEMYISNNNKVVFSVHDGTAYRDSTSNTVLTANTWYHLTGVVIGTSVKLYVNGVLQGAQGTLTAAVSTSNESLTLGADPGSGGTTFNLFFDGKMDEVKIFNYALSPLQIREEYNGGFGTYFK